MILADFLSILPVWLCFQDASRQTIDFYWFILAIDGLLLMTLSSLNRNKNTFEAFEHIFVDSSLASY